MPLVLLRELEPAKGNPGLYVPEECFPSGDVSTGESPEDMLEIETPSLSWAITFSFTSLSFSISDEARLQAKKSWITSRTCSGSMR